MYLGIEIGGTKLQLGIGSGEGPGLQAYERRDIDAERGARRILSQIKEAGGKLVRSCSVQRVGIGFGGPVHSDTGRVIRSHQVDGWEDMPLSEWCEETFGVPAVLGNDCDAAALAEAFYGAGRGKHTVFFLTVGTGIGGGCVMDGRLHGAGRPAVAEIGHLRPGLHTDATVESQACGPAISGAARRRMVDTNPAEDPFARDLLTRCNGQVDALTAKQVGEAAAGGNELAMNVLREACRVLGWGIAQVITLLAPETVVVGGGVSLIGESCFFGPLRREVRRFVFPPLAGSYELVPAQLGELVVVNGAIALAKKGRTMKDESR